MLVAVPITASVIAISGACITQKTNTITALMILDITTQIALLLVDNVYDNSKNSNISVKIKTLSTTNFAKIIFTFINKKQGIIIRLFLSWKTIQYLIIVKIYTKITKL